MSELPNRPGTYSLVLKLNAPRSVKTRCRIFELPRGVYVYVGSARGPGGIATRVSRHLLGRKRPYWHIDFMIERSQAAPRSVIYCRSERPLEASLCQLMCEDENFLAIPGFGSSDDPNVVSHLFRFRSSEIECIRSVIANYERLGLKPSILSIELPKRNRHRSRKLS